MPSEKSGQSPTLLKLCEWAWGYALRRWPLLVVVVVSRGLGICLDLLRPWPMVVLVDYALRGKKLPTHFATWIKQLGGTPTPLNLINLAVAATVIVFLLGWVVGLANRYSILCLGQRMTYDLARDVFSKLQQHSLQYHAKSAIADNMRRITSDSKCAAAIILNALLPALASVFSLISIIDILWRLDWVLALMALSVIPYMALVLSRFSVPLKKSSHELYTQQGRLRRLVEQSFTTIPVVQAFCREDANVMYFSQIARAISEMTLSRNRINWQFSMLLGFATAGGNAAILWWGGQKALVGTMSVGTIIAFLSYLGSLYRPLEALLRTGPTLHEAENQAGNILEILQSENPIKEKRGAKKLQVSHGHVQFDNVTFGYDPGRPVLRNITLEARPGQTIALVGVSGAGKSTLTSLLPRFFDPWRGAVFIDGQNVRDLQLNSLRNNIGIVLQEPFLFPVSLAENIAYANPAASFSQIEAAARVADAHEFISKLPEGYDTVVGEGGATLSGGERQRISIARALLKNAPILILDEPTSALDKETERRLMEALARLACGRTTFVIAHRLSTIRTADSIVVLEDGQIVERGKHDHLVTLAGLYAEFHALQSGNSGK